MGEVKYPVITISRQYSAYGRTIAKALQDRLGIPYYDKDFVRKTAEESGFSEEDIAREGEMMSRASKFMNSLLNNAAVYTSSYDGIYEAQKAVILKLSEAPCIIVGRCANHILREAGIPSFDIYLYGDEESRVKRAAELSENAEVEEKDLARHVEKIDSLRETYYRKYTGTEMGAAGNYSICLDVMQIGVDTCVEILCKILA